MQSLKPFILVILLVFSLVGVNAIGKFYANDPIRAGQELDILSVIRNPTNDDFEDVNVRLFIYDLGIMIPAGSFDIDDKESKVARVYWNVPNSIPSGMYLAKLSASNKDFRDSKHFYITII